MPKPELERHDLRELHLLTGKPAMYIANVDESGLTRDNAHLSALRARAAHSGPIDEDTLVYRIEFHAVNAHN